MKIRIAKPAQKYISTCDAPTKQRLKKAIQNLPSGDVKKLQGYQNDYRLKFIPSDMPTEEEMNAINNARESIATDGTVSFDSIDWD